MVNCKNIESFGAIVLKPHAINSGLDSPVEQVLFANTKERSTNLGLDNMFWLNWGRVTLIKTLIRNTADHIFGGSRFLEHYTREVENNEFFPLLKTAYTGQIKIYALQYPGPFSELKQLMLEVKGKECSLGADSQLITEPSGIRGYFKQPAQFVPKERLNALPWEEKSIIYTNIISNIMHTTESPEETASLLSVTLMNYDRAELIERGIDVSGFIQRYYPIAISAYVQDSLF